jgi:hypothetical protein
MNEILGRVRPLAALICFALATTAPLAGCGGGDDGDPAARFVGNWEYTSGTGTITCPGGLPPMMLTWTGALPFTRGTDAALEVVKPLGDQRCTIKLGVQGAVATAPPNQTCMVSAMVMGMTFMATLKIDSYIFTLTGEGMTEAGSGTVTPAAFPINCMFTSTGQLKKAP